jgi:hypothetical protein
MVHKELRNDEEKETSLLGKEVRKEKNSQK